MRLTLVMLSFLLLFGCDPHRDPLPDYGLLPDLTIVASARNLETRGLLWVLPNTGGTTFTSDTPRELTIAPVVTILIHGYNTPPSKVSTYFEGLT